MAARQRGRVVTLGVTSGTSTELSSSEQLFIPVSPTGTVSDVPSEDFS